ncbi:MAG: GNAT family N-acetyltransferase [Peptoclostridium sp.]|uniref:GNAT family N-acetyltransferase n=1 Tax=Peptoclostridium sp. TaxID=1904860 RepID=UPI00139E5A35|nr:GNAT family N-acetyltransferase [Peptoclostridium sp.]MZQ76360.1 GNAT family N-acetyltransferase [Peptoclostridium sp.]
MFMKADFSDINQIMEIVRLTVPEMNAYGNYQWTDSYPQASDFTRDIENGDLYVYKNGDHMLGFICINSVEAPEYSKLKWASDEKSIVVHRLAVNPEFRKQGIATRLLDFAETFALERRLNHIKTDTNSLNVKMDSLFKKRGYNVTGEVHFPGTEAPFVCYEKLLCN